MVPRGCQCQTCHRICVTIEIANVSFILHVQQPEIVVDFGTRMEKRSLVVGETRKVDAIFLAWNCLLEFALLDIKELNGIIIAGCDKEFAAVVEVQGSHMGRGIRLGTSERLNESIE